MIIPEIQARLAEKDGRDGHRFTGTPGLTAVRLHLSIHCTGNPSDKTLAVLDDM